MQEIRYGAFDYGSFRQARVATQCLSLWSVAWSAALDFFFFYHESFMTSLLMRVNSHSRRIAKAVCSFAAPLRRCYNEQDRCCEAWRQYTQGLA